MYVVILEVWSGEKLKLIYEWNWLLFFKVIFMDEENFEDDEIVFFLVSEEEMVDNYGGCVSFYLVEECESLKKFLL